MIAVTYEDCNTEGERKSTGLEKKGEDGMAFMAVRIAWFMFGALVMLVVVLYSGKKMPYSIIEFS